MAKVKYKLMRGKNYLIFPLDFVDKVLTKIANRTSESSIKYAQLKTLSLKVVRRMAWEEMKPLNFKFIPLTDEEFRYLSAEIDNPI